MSDFVHLHCHTHYSLLDGLGKPHLIAKRAKELGMTACAMTDHGVMYGAIEFYKACKAEGIKPIIGNEIYITKDMTDKSSQSKERNYNHLTLLAKDQTGYTNLMKITTESHLHGFYYKPRADKSLLEKYGAGIIALSGCIKGALPQAILRQDEDDIYQQIQDYQNIFGKDNFYLEVQNNPGIPEQDIINKRIFELGEELDIKIVASNDCHYVNKDDRYAHDVLICVSTKKVLADTDRMSYMHDDYSMISPAEMANIFSDHPEVIKNTLEVAGKCNLEIELHQNLIPYFQTPDKKTAQEYLRELCFTGCQERYSFHPTDTQLTTEQEKTKERLFFELDTIHNMGFDTYFLIVWDFVNYAHQNNITVGPGRGSAAGSIISYCLHITNLDPLKYDLLFERFLNPERISMPDIDLDFADQGRDQVLEYVTEKYGRENVAQIITFGTLAARAAIRDVGRVMDIPYNEVDLIAKTVPGKPGTKLADALAKEKDLKEIYEASERNKNLIDMAIRLEGVVRHSSVHACAVVISEKPLTNYTPLQIASKGEETLITQYSMKPIEEIGLLKMDFLGLSNLSTIANAVKIIQARHNIDINIDQLATDDSKTYQLLSRGDTTGIFQLESSGMKRYLKELKPTEFEDIIAMVALYRPGPMDYIQDYINSKHGIKKVQYPHPSLEKILKVTYGIGVYQEQILQIARTFAGFTLGEADILRRAIGKKIKSELDAQRAKFIAGALKLKHDETDAIKIFDDVITPFAGYGFNKSHAACYAFIAYQTAYLKANYPTEFMCALLMTSTGNIDRQTVEMNECEAMSIRVLPPAINISLKKFTIDQDGNIRFGLSAIKNLGQNTIQEIITVRNTSGTFTSLEDLITRIDSKAMNKKSLEALAKSGALDEFAGRNQILNSTEQILKFNKEIRQEASSDQLNFFELLTDQHDDLKKPTLQLVDSAETSIKQVLDWEKEFLGTYITFNPLQIIKTSLFGQVTPISTITAHETGTEVKLAGIISRIKKITTRRGDNMAFAYLEDPSGKLELVIFAGVLEKYRDLISEGALVKVQGKVTTKDSDIKIIADTITALDISNIKPSKDNISLAKDLTINIPEGTHHKTIEKLKRLLQAYQGEDQCLIKLNTTQQIKVPFHVMNCPTLQNEIKKILTF